MTIEVSCATAWPWSSSSAVTATVSVVVVIVVVVSAATVPATAAVATAAVATAAVVAATPAGIAVGDAVATGLVLALVVTLADVGVVEDDGSNRVHVGARDVAEAGGRKGSLRVFVVLGGGVVVAEQVENEVEQAGRDCHDPLQWVV